MAELKAELPKGWEFNADGDLIMKNIAIYCWAPSWFLSIALALLAKMKKVEVNGYDFSILTCRESPMLYVQPKRYGMSVEYSKKKALEFGIRLIQEALEIETEE